MLSKTAHFSVTLATLGFILSVVMITLAAHFALGWLWLESILLGSIVGGSSSAIVFGLGQKYQNFRRNKIYA